MTIWAGVTAHGAAHATIANGGINPSDLGGFAVGALLTGVLLMLVVAPRMMRKSRPATKEKVRPAGTRHARVRPDYFADPADGVAFGSANRDDADTDSHGGGIGWSAVGKLPKELVRDVGRAGYQSKHRMRRSASPDRPSERGHLPPKHAAAAKFVPHVPEAAT